MAFARGDVFARRVLVDQNAKRTSLAAQAQGEHLVVVVMKGYWCRVCIAQLERLGQLTPTLESLAARVVGLNADAPESNHKMTEDEGIESPVLSDKAHEVLSALGLWLPREQHPLPAIVLFDRCGGEVARWVGRHSPPTNPTAMSSGCCATLWLSVRPDFLQYGHRGRGGFSEWGSCRR